MIGSTVARRYDAEMDLCVLRFGAIGTEPLWSPAWIPGSELAKLRKIGLDGTPCWIDPIAEGGTPLCQALSDAERLLAGWLRKNSPDLPPTVIVICDGASTDGEPDAPMTALRGVMSEAGSTLLFAVQLIENVDPIIFPTDCELSWGSGYGCRETEYVRMLCRNVSQLSEVQFAASEALGFSLPSRSLNPKGLAVNVTARGLMAVLATFTNKPTWRR